MSLGGDSHGLEQDVPTGFSRVRRVLADEQRETLEKTRRLAAILRRLSGFGEEAGGGNLRMVRF